MKILVIDDDKNNIKLMKKYLEDKKYTVDYAQNGKEGFEKIKNNKYNYIFLDLIMPIKDGFYVLDKIKQEQIKTNIILLTSYVLPEIIEKAMNYEIKMFLCKPIQKKELYAKITSIEKIKHHNKIDTILSYLNIDSTLKGYQYLKESITLQSRDNNLKITKDIYPTIAIKFNTTQKAVERAIRTAILNSTETCSAKQYNKIFYKTNIENLSNKKFINGIMNYIKTI